MSFNYLLSDMISRLKVGIRGNSHVVRVKNSRLCRKVLNILMSLGYISGYQEDLLCSYYLFVYLSYDDNNVSVIKDISCISSPGNRVYLSVNQLKKHYKYHRIETLILSTDVGLLTNFEAIVRNVGGEALLWCSS